MKLNRTVLVVLAVGAILGGGAALAADVEKKWRISFSAGQFDSTEKIDSDAANVLQVVNPDFTLDSAFIDPRDDSDAFTNLSVEPAARVTVSAQYALSKIFLVEGSVGYQKGDVGDVQMSVQFDNVERLPELPFRFEAFNLPAGELERIPIQLSGILRLRPRAKFNPYFGAGIGYSVIGFEPSPELNDLSRNMDASSGQSTSLTAVTAGTPVLLPIGPVTGLSGATVDARDTFEWHLVSGAELSVKRAWSLFLDMRWVDSSREFSIGFNGADSLGVSVPQFIDFVGSPLTLGPFGPVRIDGGGLIDAGQQLTVLNDGVPVPTGDPFGIVACMTDDEFCEPRFFSYEQIAALPQATQNAITIDDELDSGFYYAQGGSVAYDGFSLQFGFRYTFGKK